jgi:hypothetical protein
MAQSSVFTQAWKDATATAKRETKAKRKAAAPTKPKKPRTKKDNTKHCDLCGRGINDRAVVIGPGEVWCWLCTKNHSLYPTPCKSCDGKYHFKPGETVISDIDHLAQLAPEREAGWNQLNQIHKDSF